MTSFLQQLLDPFDSGFPALLLFAIEAFEGVDRGFGNVLRLQVLRQNGYVVLEPLEVVAFDGTDALEHFAGIEGGFGGCERVRDSGWRLAFDEGDSFERHAKAHEIGSGNVDVDFFTSVMDLENLVDHHRLVRADFVADLGRGRGLRGRGFLAGFGHDSR
jgi:hypothetical protein